MDGAPEGVVGSVAPLESLQELQDSSHPQMWSDWTILHDSGALIPAAAAAEVADLCFLNVHRNTYNTSTPLSFKTPLIHRASVHDLTDLWAAVAVLFLTSLPAASGITEGLSVFLPL